ncbi:MAG TPA: orotidine-5'-phosphate decarboxylase [Verrucomicrobiota bacterium]|nr:orotidine-5'-phosphate decarboxylase [Verrucomicrobiota bacterium]
MQNPVIVALDLPSPQKALKLAGELAPVVGAFKVGKQLFISGGPDIVRKLRATGANVFLDLKLHDIPNTVAKAVIAVTDLGVQMATVHASGGTTMLAAAENAAHEQAAMLRAEPPLVLGVTVLTSMDDGDLAELGIEGSAQEQVLRLAKLATGAGLRGLVCSPQDIEMLRAELGDDVQLVIPGIRPASSKDDDQKRTMIPAEAIQAGANWLVIGRPITGADNPKAATIGILHSINPELVPEGERTESIPEVVDCAKCGKSLKLDATEQATGRYHCPHCDRDIAHNG